MAERVETPTEELLRGIAKTLQREAAEDPDNALILGFLAGACLDCYEEISNSDAS